MKTQFKKRKLLYGIVLFCGVFFLNSCASVPPQPPPLLTLPGPRVNVVHTVAPGETFWRISKMYDVPMASIIDANHLKSKQPLRMGQKLVIPQAASIKPIISLYPSRKWKYIIIHHSATEIGNSLAFHKIHLGKGWDKGVGYHFIIDNGRSGKQDGQIEVAPRWLKQQDGAHCKASDMNYKGIGICLVGNFSVERVSKKQMQSLVYLVNTLKEYYRIPEKNILRHGHVRGAATECPGSKFPWAEFKRKLK